MGLTSVLVLPPNASIFAVSVLSTLFFLCMANSSNVIMRKIFTSIRQGGSTKQLYIGDFGVSCFRARLDFIEA